MKIIIRIISEKRSYICINCLRAFLYEKSLLSQNFPNPFNPVTYIKFALPRSSYVKLMIYDMLGREMETLVNERLTAGTIL